MTPCPCGSGADYSACCEPYLNGQAHAPTAEALMRSRYTAFATGEVEYLIATHHPSQRAPDSRRQLRQTINTTTWLGLTVLQTSQGQASDTVGQVEFVALYQRKSSLSQPQPSTVEQLHERSTFIKHKTGWLYVEGESLPPMSPKRNAPCWCGSGQKFKHCHGQR